MTYDDYTSKICNYAIETAGARQLADKIIKFRPMKRTALVNPKRGYVIGRTNLKTGLITIDIYTPVNRKPKTVASILRTLAHELAHHQKPPFRQHYRGRVITRSHYPEFYQQVNKNILQFKKDINLKKYF